MAVPATDLSDTISKDMKSADSNLSARRSFTHMQATGMVNDHLTGCFRYKALVGRNNDAA
jgi:DNA-3-methyladenine glycosylase I